MLRTRPSFEDQAVLDFFETSGRNLLAAERAAGVRHHIALSVVGTDRLLESGYFRGKMAQAGSRTRPTAASGAMFPEIICLPLVATKTTGVSLSRRLSGVVHFPPVRAWDDPCRRGVPAKTGQLRDEATGGTQSQGRHFSTDQEFAMDEIRDLDNPMPRLISCPICQHEIPLSEAVVPEAADSATSPYRCLWPTTACGC